MVSTNPNQYCYQALNELGDNELIQISTRYSIGKKGIFLHTHNGFPISISLGQITLEKKFENPEGNLEYEMVFTLDSKKRSLLIGHRDLLPQRLSALSIKGVPVDHNNVKDLSNALSALGSQLRAITLTNQIGFFETNDGIRYVGVPNDHLLTTDTRRMFDLDTSGTAKEEFGNVKNLVLGHPALELAYLLGLTSIVTWILNKMLGIDVFPMFYYLFGESSSGKSTATIVALSPFGNPSPRDSQSFVQTYASTDLSLIKYVSYLNGFALGIDDFGSSSSKDKTSFLYTFVNGKVKSRATSEGNVIQGAGFEAVGIGNGEESFRDNLSDHVGVQLRVCEFNNLTYTVSSKHSESLKKAFTSTYGHIAQEFADVLLDYDFAALKGIYEKELESLLKSIGENPSSMVHRYAKQLAIITTTGSLFNDAFDFTFCLPQIRKLVESNISETMYRLDNARFAHTKIITYVLEHLNQFEIEGKPRIHEGQWLGSIKTDTEGVSRIRIPVETMKRIAQELQLPDLTPLMNKMKKERLIEAEKGHNTKKIKSIRCYVIRAENFLESQ